MRLPIVIYHAVDSRLQRAFRHDKVSKGRIAVERESSRRDDNTALHVLAHEGVVVAFGSFFALEGEAVKILVAACEELDDISEKCSLVHLFVGLRISGLAVSRTRNLLTFKTGESNVSH